MDRPELPRRYAYQVPVSGDVAADSSALPAVLAEVAHRFHQSLDREHRVLTAPATISQEPDLMRGGVLIRMEGLTVRDPVWLAGIWESAAAAVAEDQRWLDILSR